MYILKLLRELITSLTNNIQRKADIIEAENELASYSNYDFVIALRPIAQKLSEQTGTEYYLYLYEAKVMILNGKGKEHTLKHFKARLQEGKE